MLETWVLVLYFSGYNRGGFSTTVQMHSEKACVAAIDTIKDFLPFALCLNQSTGKIIWREKHERPRNN